MVNGDRSTWLKCSKSHCKTTHPRPALAACSRFSPSRLTRKPRDEDDIGVGNKEGFVPGYLAMPENGFLSWLVLTLRPCGPETQFLRLPRP